MYSVYDPSILHQIYDVLIATNAACEQDRQEFVYAFGVDPMNLKIGMPEKWTFIGPNSMVGNLFLRDDSWFVQFNFAQRYFNPKLAPEINKRLKSLYNRVHEVSE